MGLSYQGLQHKHHQIHCVLVDCKIWLIYNTLCINDFSTGVFMKKVIISLLAIYSSAIFAEESIYSNVNGNLVVNVFVKNALLTDSSPQHFSSMVESAINTHKWHTCFVIPMDNQYGYGCGESKYIDNTDLIVNKDNSIDVKSKFGQNAINDFISYYCRQGNVNIFPLYSFGSIWSSNQSQSVVGYPQQTLTAEDNAKLAFFNKYGVIDRFCNNLRAGGTVQGLIDPQNTIAFAIKRVGRIQYSSEDTKKQLENRENSNMYKQIELDDNIFPYKLYYLNSQDAKIAAQNLYSAYTNAPLQQYQKQQKSISLAKAQDDANKIAAKYNLFRSKLSEGDTTNCGTIIQLKQKLAYIQTGSDAGAVWINREFLYPQVDDNGKVIGCKDSNRWYKRYGNWVTGNGSQFIQNSTPFNDANSN